MRKTMIDKSMVLRNSILVLLFVFLISICAMLLRQWEINQSFQPNAAMNEDSVSYHGKEYVLKENIDTFLIIGLDKFEGNIQTDSYNNDQCADFLMLFVFDNDAKTYSALHVNRDTMVDINVLGVAGNRIDTVRAQIALSHTYGNGREVSCRNTADSLSSLLLGMKVDHYISLTLDAVPVINDLVDGIELTIPDDYTTIDRAFVKGQTLTLSGEQALRYIRMRSGLEDSSNDARMERQQQYFLALADRIGEFVESDDAFVVDVSMALSDYIVSDRSVTQLQALGEKFSEYECVQVAEIEGKMQYGDRFVEFYADKKSVEEVVINLFYRLKND